MEVDLPQIDAPEAAIAETNQRQYFATIPIPRGVITRIMPGTPTMYKTPHKQSANWFKEVYNGFMNAQSIGFANCAGDVLKLFHSESLDLQTAACAQVGYKTPDESQHPRRVAVWLIGEYGGHNSNDNDLFLDAFSKWANTKFAEGRVVNHIRMTALFGVDAKQVLDMAKHELPETFHGIEINQTFVMLRWHNGNSFQSAIRNIGRESSIHYSLFCPMKNLQDGVVRLSGVHNVPIPPICMKNAGDEIGQEQDFYHILNQVSEEFFDLLMGKPSITFSSNTIERKASRILLPTGCIVRVCNKALGDKRLVDPSCFHGAILAHRSEMKQVQEFLKLSDEEGVRPPVSKDEHRLGLHLCAVQAESMQLKSCVSLYGSSGIAGKPIHSPGSWVWVARPAVRPLGPDLLNVFSLHPCSKLSLLPSRKELIPAFERFWTHTTSVYKMITDGVPLRESEQSNKRSRSPSTITDLELDDRDAAIIAMMQLDMKSQRTTLGDAYAQISMFQNTAHVASNMMETMRAIGIRSSLWQMFEYNQSAIARVRDIENSQTSGEDCFLKFAEVVLEAASAQKRAKLQTSHEPVCLSAERVRRIIKVCSLKSGLHVTLEHGHGTIAQYGDTLQSIVLTSTSDGNVRFDSRLSTFVKRPLEHIFAQTNTKHEWLGVVEQCVANSASKAMVSAANLNSSLFMIIGTRNKDEVFIKTINLDGSIANGSLDAMCKIARPRVIILQEITEGKIRVMGTTQAVATDSDKSCAVQN